MLTASYNHLPSAGVTAGLYLLDHDGVGHGFVSLLGLQVSRYLHYLQYLQYLHSLQHSNYLPLQVSVLYAGAGLRVTWHTAVARAVVGGVTRVRTAAAYRLAVAATQGEQCGGVG